jgi:hypothetical protein
MVVVFEGLLGLLPDVKARTTEQAYRRAHRWQRAVNAYEINELMAKHIWDVVWRFHYSVDICTYLGDDMADAITERLDRENLPVGNVFATQPNLLARRIALMPNIAAIYDPDPAHRFTYGSKGRFLSPTNPNLMGNF